MSEMLERVAQVIYGLEYKGEGPTLDQARDDARKIIVSMREPTAEMIFAGRDQSDPLQGLHAWRKMIVEALKP